MIIPQRFQTWLNAPEVFDDKDRRQIDLFNLVFKWGTIFLLGTLLFWSLFSSLSNSERYLYISLSLIIGLFVTKLLLNQGWVKEAGYLLAAVFWLTFSVAALKHPDGIVSIPFLAAITIAPIIAGFVIGTKASIFTALLNWGLGGYLTWVDLHDAVRSAAYFEEPLFRYFVLMIMVSVFPLIVYVWQRNLHIAVEQVRIAEQAQAETAVYRLQNEALEEAVQARTADLEKSLERERHLALQLTQALEAETQLGELQSRIITVVSHEFRTPLSVIYSSTQLLHEYYEKLPQTRRDAAHQRIEEAIFYLNGLLKDVALVGRAQREGIQPAYQSFAFNELCQRLTEAIMHETNQPQRISFAYAATVATSVQTDLALLEKIVGGLVANGLKYSGKGSPVQVRLWLDKPQFVIEVQDHGIGIPLHEQPKVFDLFYRASNVDERRGLGLGLFIVQAISKMMQGHVALISQGNGCGSTFQVYLPLVPELESVKAKAASVSSPVG